MLWGLLLGGTLGPGSAAAKPPGASRAGTEQAKQDVLTALSVGNPGHAEEILDRAFRADPDPALLYQLGLVAQAQGRPIAALDLYRRYQELVGSAAGAETTTAIEHFAASLTAPFTVLNVTSSAGMLPCVDDKIVGMLPLRSPLLLAGGMHRFRIEHRSEHYETGTLSIPDGREAELRLTPGAKGTAVALLSLSPITLFDVQPKTLSPAAAQAVQKALVEGARQNHLAPLVPSRLALLLGKRPAGCLDQPDCQFAVAEQAQARSVLRVLVKQEAAKDSAPDPAGAALSGCSLELQYLDVNAGQVAASGTTEPTSCGGTPLTDALSAVIQKLISEANGRPRGMVSISSVPEDAQVRVDGLLRGPTPYLRASFSGPHEIVVEKAGFHPFGTQVEVVSGQVVALQAPLIAMPEPEPAPAALAVSKREWVDRQRPRPRWRLVLGGAALGGGVLLAGFGISALPLHGLCAQGPVDGGVCDASFETATVGGGLVGVGLALSAAGAVLLALPSRRERVLESVSIAAVKSASIAGHQE